MSLDMSTLVARYLDSCKSHDVLPNSAILSALYKAMLQKRIQQECTVVLSLDELEDSDLSPVIDSLLKVHSFSIDAVDIICRSQSILNQECVLSLIRAVNPKLRIANLQDMLLKKDIIWELFEGGSNCHILKLRSTEISKLNVTGNFVQLHTLNLDFCSSLVSMDSNCFANMPNLTCLSMCGTRVTDLWTTSSALSRLTCLAELRFQNCICCKDTGTCLASSNDSDDLVSTGNQELPDDLLDRVLDQIKKITALDLSSASYSGPESLELEVPAGELNIQEKNESPHPLKLRDTSIVSEMYVSHHASPVCFEKHYREYMIASLPYLQVLDNLPVRKKDREMAKAVFSTYYEYLPYKRQHKESVVRVLHTRETGTNNLYSKKTASVKRLPASRGNSQFSYCRSLCAAKFEASSANPLSEICDIAKEDSKIPQPRQFEYHPSHPSIMSFGTLDGEVVVVNHERGNIVTRIPPFGMTNSVLGLSWLNKHPSKLLVGSDDGSLRLYDINRVAEEAEGYYNTSVPVVFENFEHLTSVHVNSTDDRFLTSGYSKKVAIYDICSGKRLHVFSDMHTEPINVAKFANHSPNLLVTSSFDHDVKLWDLRQQPMRPCYTASSSRGNVMVCFSPDDLYLLVSAVDNEVKQLLAVDGRVHIDFGIHSTGSAHNYTRSYYMNRRDYIISGSSDESVVRVCCAQTGRRLKDLYLEDRDFGHSMFVQSLRSDPFRHFHLAVLATYAQPCSKRDIIKVNLLESAKSKEHLGWEDSFQLSNSLGG